MCNYDICTSNLNKNLWKVLLSNLLQQKKNAAYFYFQLKIIKRSNGTAKDNILWFNHIGLFCLAHDNSRKEAVITWYSIDLGIAELLSSAHLPGHLPELVIGRIRVLVLCRVGTVANTWEGLAKNWDGVIEE